MKHLLVILLLLTSASLAQQNSNPNIQDGAVEITPWVGGGTGVGASSDFKFFETGVRVGKIITSEIGTGRFRWRFEYAGDVMPVYLVNIRQGGWVYGGGFNPVVLKFAFTANKKIVPVSRSEWRRAVLDATGSTAQYVTGELHVGRAGRVSLFREREAGNHVLDPGDSYFECKPWESQPRDKCVRAFPAGIYDFQIARHSRRTNSYEHSC